MSRLRTAFCSFGSLFKSTALTFWSGPFVTKTLNLISVWWEEDWADEWMRGYYTLLANTPSNSIYRLYRNFTSEASFARFSSIYQEVEELNTPLQILHCNFTQLKIWIIISNADLVSKVNCQCFTATYDVFLLHLTAALMCAASYRCRYLRHSSFQILYLYLVV